MRRRAMQSQSIGGVLGARIGWRHVAARRAAALRHAGDERARPGAARRRRARSCTWPSARPGLPVLPSVAERLGAAAGENSYGPVAGSSAVRAAAAGYFERRGLPTGPEQVLLAPGSKALLYALLCVLPGDVVLPRPSWVSYAAQAALAGKRVIDVAIAAEAGGVPDPAALREALAAARAQGHEPAILVLTLPDNPTGTVAPASLHAGGLRGAPRSTGC